MTTKTDIFLPKFYLVNKNLTIAVNKDLLIGRSEGEVVLEDDKLSSRHCELQFHTLEIKIKDLNSKNGIYINRQKITPNEATKLTPGDVVRIGGEEYFFVDNEEDVQKYAGKADRRKVVRSQDLYTFGGLFSFFHVQHSWRGFYILMIMLSLGTVIQHFRLEVPVPSELSFLSKLYSDLIISNGLKLIFSVWVLSLIHSYLIATHFKFKPFAQALALAPYFGAIAMIFNIDGPVWFIKHYAEDRNIVLESNVLDERAIVVLKNITSTQNRLKENFHLVQTKLNAEDKKTLQIDFDDLNNHIIENLDRLTKMKLDESSKRLPANKK